MVDCSVSESGTGILLTLNICTLSVRFKDQELYTVSLIFRFSQSALACCETSPPLYWSSTNDQFNSDSSLVS